MAKTKAKATENGASSVQPWQIPSLVDKRVYDYTPLYFEALKAIHAELTEIKELLKEK